jgi:hypothetical protein
LYTGFDAVGFTCESLVEYHYTETASLVTKNILANLVKLSPLEYASIGDTCKLSVQPPGKNIVWDIENGTLLQLKDSKRIKHGSYGEKWLNKEELKKLYGSGRIFEPYKYPSSQYVLSGHKGDHMNFSGFIDSCQIHVITHIVDLIKNGKVQKTFH